MASFFFFFFTSVVIFRSLSSFNNDSGILFFHNYLVQLFFTYIIFYGTVLLSQFIVPPHVSFFASIFSSFFTVNVILTFLSCKPIIIIYFNYVYFQTFFFISHTSYAFQVVSTNLFKILSFFSFFLSFLLTYFCIISCILYFF